MRWILVYYEFNIDGEFPVIEKFAHIKDVEKFILGNNVDEYIISLLYKEISND